MKILFVVPRYHTNMIGWVKAFVNAGDEVLINTMRQGYTESYDIVKPVVFKESLVATFLTKIFGNGGPNAPRSFPNIFTYFWYLRKEKPDVIIVRDITRWFSFLAAIYARGLGIKVVIYSQMPLYSKYSVKRKRTIDFINIFFGSFWMTPIKGNGKNAANLPNKVVYIPFVADVVEAAAMIKVNEPVSILMIGKFVDRKNHLELIKVLHDLKVLGYVFHLKVVGENSTPGHNEKLKEIRRYIVNNELENEVTILQNIPNEHMSDLYAESDLFILPASKEPASISVIEAMGYGIPVICADECGTSCYITDNLNGYIFKENDFVGLKICIEKYLNEKDKNAMRLNCRNEAQRLISSENFLNIFKQIANCDDRNNGHPVR